MTLGPIQFGGLASGLDTGAIIDAILRVERRPIDVLENRKEDERQKLSLLGTFEGLVKALRDKAEDLRLESNFFAHELTVGEEGIADFTLSGSAQDGAHTLQVIALAQSDRYAYAGVADPDTALGTGTISFTYDGTAYTVDVVAGQDTLNGIAAAINATAGDAVDATVVNVGTSSSPSYQLVIAGDDTGADFAVQGLTTSVAGLTGQTQLTAAANASIVVDGLAVQRSGNLFADVLPGISFTVSAVGGPMTFAVEKDVEGIRANLQELVDAYNEVIDFINQQSSFSQETGPGGRLFGDGALESVRGALRRALFSVDPDVVAADSEGYSSLGLVGIELQSDGRLKIDEQTFDEKLSANLDALANLFRDDTAGVLVELATELDALIEHGTTPTGKIVDGLFDARRDAVNRLIRGIDDDIDRMEENLDKLEESLVRRFSALEDLLGGLNAQSSFLSSLSFARR